MTISMMMIMIIIMIFYPTFPRMFSNLAGFLNNNRLLVNVVESSVDPLLHKS